MLKETLKNNQKFFNFIMKIDLIFRRTFSTVSPTLTSKILYRRSLGKSLNLKNPKTFNEKLMWLKLNTYKNNPLITKCVDKYSVREYVQDRGCGEILNELIGVWDSVYEIDWNTLPDQYVLKCNHGCGYNIICNDKRVLNISNVIRTLSKWMAEDYWKNYAEINYMNIPKKIICERYLKTNQGYFPYDYRFYCKNGEPKLLYVTQHIQGTDAVSRIYFDLEWNPLDIGDTLKYLDNLPVRPNCFKKMLYYAKKLANGFPFVRVDLYDYNGIVLFGELTFTPTGCISPANNSPILDELIDIKFTA